MLRKMTALFLCAALALTLGACSGPKEAVPKAAGGAFSEKYEYSMNTVDIDYAAKGYDGETAANFQWFCEKFNISFTFWPMSWSDWVEKTRIWTYSGDMPDILFLDIAPARFSEYAAAARQGAYKALPEFGTKYPNLATYKDSLMSTKYLSIDGTLYTLPKSREGQKTKDAGLWAYIYRRDWAEKLGLASEDDVYDWDEWLALIKAFVEQDPGGNGAGRTAGVGAQRWTLPKYMGGECINPYFLTFAKVDGRYVWGPTMPESLELVKTFKQMYDEGLLWRGMLEGRDADASNLYYSGLLGVLPSNMTVAGLDNFRYNFSLENQDVADVKKATALAVVRSADGGINTLQTEDFWSSFSFNANMDDAKLERILTAYDWLASEEGRKFMKYGIPGVDWVERDGEVVIQWKPNGDGTYAYPYPTLGETWMPVALKDAFNLQSPAFPEATQNEIKALQDRRLGEGSRLIPFDYDSIYFTGPEYSKAGTMEDAIVDKLCDLLLTSSDIEADWKAWLIKMEPKYKPVEDELNSLLGTAQK